MEKQAEHTVSETVKEMDEASEVESIKKIEAALFIAGKFLNLQELVMLTDVNPVMLKELIDKLVEKYNKDDSGIEIVVKENMWKMDVRQEHRNMINKLATGSAEFSKTEQETLAVIAYKQPVKQSIIIRIRGNKAYEHIKRFIEVGLVIGKKMGRTKELKLSDDFYEYFHLKDKEIERVGKENIDKSITSQEQGEDKSSLSDKQDDVDKKEFGEKEVVGENK